MPRTEGFTLLETAIALIVIALLLAMILAVDSLQTQARAREFARDATALAGAIHLYRARYGALPGDDPGATVRWPGVASGNGNGTLGGSYDQALPSNPASLASGVEDNESLLAWWHLRRAGFVIGAADGPEALATPRLGVSAAPLGLQSGAFGMTGPVACLGGASGALAESIDRKLDDGSPDTGTVRSGATIAQPAGAYGHAEHYAVCISLEGRGGPSVLALGSASNGIVATGGTPATAGTSSEASGATGTAGSGTSAGTGAAASSDTSGPTTSDTSGSSDEGSWRDWFASYRDRWSRWWGRG